VSGGKENGATPGPEETTTFLRRLAVFGPLSQEELAVVAESSVWQSFREAAVVFNERGGAGRMYAIRKGEVRISKSAADGRHVTLATYVPNESFGELSLFDREPSGTIARCESDALVLVFPDEIAPGGTTSVFREHPALEAKLLYHLLGLVARRNRSTNRLIAEKTPWVRSLRRMVALDKLTGLHNSSFLEEDLPRMLDEKPAGLHLLMIKPDDFKSFNDTYGHDAGDRVLQLMASSLRDLLEEGAVPIRYKGDVFAVALPDSDRDAACRTAEEIRKAMGGIDLSEMGAGGRRITVGIGVACGMDAGPPAAAAMVDRTYENLFAARKQGGDRTYGCG